MNIVRTLIPRIIRAALGVLCACCLLAPQTGAQTAFTTTKLGGGAAGTITPVAGAAGSFSVVGGGEDIGGSVDQFTFHHTADRLGFDWRVQITALAPNDNDTKAGLMAREAATSVSRMAYVRATPFGPTRNQAVGDGDVAMQFRSLTQGNTATCGLFDYPATPFPSQCFVRLEMHGSVVGSYRSADGVNWVLLCDQDTASWPGGRLVDNLQVGLAVSRGPQGASTTATAEFRQLLTSEQGPLPPTITSIPDQTIDEDKSTAALPFLIADADTAAAALVVSRTTSASGLIPLSGIILTPPTPGAASTAWTVQITPTAGQSGDADIGVTVSDSVRSATAYFHVHVNPVVDPPKVDSGPLSQSLVEGSPLVLEAKISGDPPFQFQWRRNGFALANGDGATFRLPAVQFADRGSYDVIVSNPAGKDQSKPATIEVIQLDYGDAPDPKYPTLKANNGASHRIRDGFSLGEKVDGEMDGQSNATASGDGADDDGVVFNTPMVQGESTSLTVTVRLPVGLNSSHVDAWIDWNSDGDWLDAGEHVIDAAQAAGPKSYSFVVPAAAVVGTHFARVRLSEVGKLESVGASEQSGEVEDYLVTISTPAPALDFGDAPDPKYPTLLANDGARHVINPDVKLGARIDAEKDGQPDAIAKGDDATPSPSGDEDGIVFNGPLVPGQSTTVQVTVTTSGRLSAWFDWGGDGNWADAGDIALLNQAIPGGVSTVTISVPGNAKVGKTFARFRYSRQGIATPTGLAADGEVEDYAVQIEAALDFGDAPDSYRTKLVSDGPRHIPLKGFTLGKTIDAEGDGQPSAGASGDGSDEDGVAIGSLTAGTTETIEVVSSAPGKLDGWMDFNGDGDFLDAGERIFSAQTIPGGLVSLSVQIPLSAKPGSSFARFRFSKAGVKDFFGPGEEGEVEDYAIRIGSARLDFGDAPEVIPGAAGNLVTQFPTTLQRDGARHTLRKGFTLGRVADPEADGQPTSSANGDDLNPQGLDDEDGVIFPDPLVPGQVAIVRVIAPQGGLLDAWIDFEGNESWGEAGNRIFNAQPLPLLVNDLPFLVPANARPGSVIARFRLSDKGGLNVSGYGGDGEVEDHPVEIQRDKDRCDLGCTGREFWLTFPGNYHPDPANKVKPQLCIVGQKGTTVTISIAGLGYLNNFVMPANSANITLPADADLGDLNDAVANKGVHVVASEPVSVYGLSQVKFTSDGYLGLPTEVLAREYIVVGYSNVHTGIPELNGTQFAVVATQPNTTLSITPSYVTPPHDSGFPYTLVLTNAGDVFQLRNTADAPADLTGTRVESDLPVAVFGGHQVANVQTSDMFFADYLVEQLPPVRRWGREFFPVYSMGRLKGDTFRVVAGDDGTEVKLDGAVVATLDKGQFYETVITSVAAHIVTSHRSLVMQYANSSDFDGVVKSDPFMVIVPPRPYFTSEHVFCTAPSGFDKHYINVVVPSSAKATVKLDGVPIGVPFFDIGASGYAYGQKEVSVGVHTLLTDKPAGVTVYGWNDYESYAWPACFSFGDTTPPQLLNCPPSEIVAEVQPGSTIDSCRVPIPDLRQGIKVEDNCGLPGSTVGALLFQDPPPGTLVGVGTHPITIGATDAAGNVGECHVNFVVKDPNPDGELTFSCPQDFTIKCNTDKGAIVNYSVTALQGCTPVRVECDPPPGSLFQPGVTTVVCRLKEPGLPAMECSFKVTVDCLKPPRVVKINLQPNPNGVRALKLEWDDDNADQVVVESADRITGPWLEVPAARSGFTVEITEALPGKYYRLRER